MNQQNFSQLQQIQQLQQLQQPQINQSQLNEQQLMSQQQLNQQLINQQQYNQQSNQDDIGDIINEINNQEQSQQLYSQPQQFINESYNINKMYNINEFKEKGIKYLKKVIMIIIIYLIISSEQFKNISSKYISFLKPDENGKLKLSSKIFYGFVLAALIILSNEFILNHSI